MIIGTVRVEEARVYDSHEGYHEFHAAETQEPYGSFEVFWIDQHLCEFQGIDASCGDDCDGWHTPAGWYWAAGFPGCLYDGEPMGPFASSQQAHEDADEWAPEYDD